MSMSSLAYLGTQEVAKDAELLDKLIKDVFDLIPKNYRVDKKPGQSLHIDLSSSVSHSIRAVVAQYEALLLIKEQGGALKFNWDARQNRNVDKTLARHLKSLDPQERYLDCDDNHDVHEFEIKSGKWCKDGKPLDWVNSIGRGVISYKVDDRHVKHVASQYSWMPQVDDELSYQLALKLSKFFKDLSSLEQDETKRNELIKKHNLLVNRYRAKFIAEQLDIFSRQLNELHELSLAGPAEQKKIRSLNKQLSKLEKELKKVRDDDKNKNKLQTRIIIYKESVSRLSCVPDQRVQLNKDRIAKLVEIQNKIKDHTYELNGGGEKIYNINKKGEREFESKLVTRGAADCYKFIADQLYRSGEDSNYLTEEKWLEVQIHLHNILDGKTNATATSGCRLFNLGKRSAADARLHKDILEKIDKPIEITPVKPKPVKRASATQFSAISNPMARLSKKDLQDLLGKRDVPKQLSVRR